MTVKPMLTPNGNVAKNQFEIFDERLMTTYFQSYDSIIIKMKFHKGMRSIYLDKNLWDCSKTTGKYRNIFLGETKKETLKKIKSGEYILTNLN